MATARSTFRTRIKYRAANRGDLTNALLDAWLDAGLLELAMRVEIRNLTTFDTTQTFTVGLNTITYPSGYIAINQIRNTTKDWPLIRREWISLRRMKIVSGDPRSWAVYGNTLILDKTATTADALSLAGIQRPTWAAGDSATPGIDNEYEYGIELMAALHMFRDLGDTSKAALIDNPSQPGRGEFHIWLQANKFPSMLQGTAPIDDVVWPNLEGYDGVS